MLDREARRQQETLSLVAASSHADPSVLACQASELVSLTAEGYPGARFHAGCEVADEVERLAIARACAAFGARWANVQPHSGTSANQVVMFGLLQPGDTILGMELSAGGHLSHGARASVSGRHFRAIGYGVGRDGRLDFDEIRRLAHEHRPRLLIAGASSYPRQIDFAAFRRIADEVGAWLLADISHVAGLVAAGLHPSPIDHAHVTSTSTYKQLGGPRGGLLLMGRDCDTLAERLQSALFPLTQGTPNLAAIAAKARALAIVATPRFRALAQRIVANARALAEALAADWTLVTGGTENHMVLVDLSRTALSGLEAERALEASGLIANRNRISGDGPRENGIRFGTNGVSQRGLEPADLRELAALIGEVLRAGREVPRVRARVAELCRLHPIPGKGADAPASALRTAR